MTLKRRTTLGKKREPCLLVYLKETPTEDAITGRTTYDLGKVRPNTGTKTVSRGLTDIDACPRPTLETLCQDPQGGCGRT